MSAHAWRRRRDKPGLRWLELWNRRHLKRKARGRKRCAKIGHGPWFWTCGSTSVNGCVVQADSGRICQRCGLYEAETSWKAAA